jgi:hypothetical protein
MTFEEKKVLDSMGSGDWFKTMHTQEFKNGKDRGPSDDMANDMADAMRYLMYMRPSDGEREYTIEVLKAQVRKAEKNLARAKQELADYQFRGTGRTTSLIKDVDVQQTLFLVWHRQDISYVANIAQEFLSGELFKSLGIMNVDNLQPMDLGHRLRSWRGPIIVDHLVWERIDPVSMAEIRMWQAYANRSRF